MRYVHTNLIVRDLDAALAFYRDVFRCEPVPPRRDLSGEWLSKGTGVPNAALRGMHLRLPGQAADGATLEVYTYADVVGAETPVANRVGFGHLAFEVDDVAATLDAVRAHGGDGLGVIVQHEVPLVGLLTFAYARDPEGNILELQRWDEAPVREVDVQTFYDAWAAQYDEDDNATRDLASDVLRQMLPPLADVSVLELGCGSGRNTVALTGAAAVTAVDFSAKMLNRARSLADNNVRFVEHDLTRPLPFEDATADLVVISLVLEHIEDIAPIYREVARVLRPDGEALVLELHPVRQRLGKRARFQGAEGVVSAPAFLHEVSAHTWAALDAGLVLEALKEHRPEDALPRLLAMRWRR